MIKKKEKIDTKFSKFLAIILFSLLTIFVLSSFSFAKGQVHSIEEPADILTGSKYILFSRPTCGYCTDFEKNLENILDSQSSVEIFKFDTDKFRENKDFEKIIKKYDVKGVPTLLRVENGVVLSRYLSQEEESEKVEAELIDYFNKDRVFDRTKEMIKFSYLIVCLISLLFFFLVIINIRTSKFSFKELVLKLVTVLIPIILIRVILGLIYYEGYFYETYHIEMPKQNFSVAIFSIIVCLATVVVVLIKAFLKKPREEVKND